MVVRPEDLGPDPFPLFSRWLAEAEAAGAGQPFGMAVATASAEGRPSVRFVLLRGFDRRGLVFYTSYRSPKARDLAENPRAEAVLYWNETSRQVRVRGPVERVPREESEGYWASRPAGHRLASAASPQSEVVAEGELQSRLRELADQYPDGEVPLPTHWGGFRLVPEVFEFWQSGEHRLHDRFRYRLSAGRWEVERLAP